MNTFLISKNEFANCRDRWNSLAGDRPFHRWEWLASWWEVFEGNRELAIAVVEDEGDWLAIAPWFISKTRSMGRVVQSLGNGAACSDYLSWLVLPGKEKVAADELASLMVDQQGPFADVDLFDLEGFDANDDAMNSLLDAVELKGFQVERSELAGTWRTRLAGSWEEFNAGLSKSFRRKTKKAQSRLDSDKIETATFQAPKEIEVHWKEFVRLHQLRRESIGQAGCFADDLFETFLQKAVMRMAECDLARLHLLTWNGQSLAVDLEFSAGADVLMYQTGMEPELSNQEPGHTLFTWAIQRAIANGKSSFDFLRGDEPYKQRWNSERVPLYRAYIVPTKLTARLRHGIWTTGKSLKAWARQKLVGQNEGS